jgi:adenylate cyclase
MMEVQDPASRELRSAELRSERLSAAIRAVVFLVLLAVFARIGHDDHPNTYAALSLSIYGLVTAAALILAWRRIFHLAVAYVLVTLDVVLVAVHLTLLVRLLALPHAMAYAVPAYGLVFLVLAHAALRFRPWLVVYAATLFVAVLEGSRLLSPEGGPSAAPGMADPAHQPYLYQHVLPLSVIGLTALALWAAGTETRRMLGRAIEHGRRAANLSRFFSPAVAERLSAASDPGARGGRRSVAILFVDMRGFSALGQTLSPDALALLLTEFREVVAEPVFAHGGSIDKFIGDGALILFGMLESRPNDAARALDCAEAILRAVRSWSERRRLAGEAPVRVGVGGHYGEVFAGVVGRGVQLEFTVIGDAVNAAERIERITRQADCELVVSETLLTAAGIQAGGEDWQALAFDSLPGHGARIPVFVPRLRVDCRLAPSAGGT